MLFSFPPVSCLLIKFERETDDYSGVGLDHHRDDDVSRV